MKRSQRVNPDARPWIEASQEDLRTVEVLLGAGRDLHALFYCQQAVEKRLKALVIQLAGRMPPRTHNLVRIARLAGLPLPLEREVFLRRLTGFYVRTRYPGEVQTQEVRVTAELARRYVEQTREVLVWLDQQMS